MIVAMSDLAETLVSAAALSALLGISSQRVGQLASEGLFTRIKGKFKLGDAVPAYTNRLRTDVRRSSAAEEKVRTARAAEIEARTAERLHRLVDKEETLAAVDDVLGVLVSALCSVPAQVTQDLRLREVIEAKIDDARRIAVDRLAAHAAALRASGQAAPPRGSKYVGG
jgi:hypothetical protein